MIGCAGEAHICLRLAALIRNVSLPSAPNAEQQHHAEREEPGRENSREAPPAHRRCSVIRSGALGLKFMDELRYTAQPATMSSAPPSDGFQG